MANITPRNYIGTIYNVQFINFQLYNVQFLINMFTREFRKLRNFYINENLHICKSKKTKWQKYRCKFLVEVKNRHFKKWTLDLKKIAFSFF